MRDALIQIYLHYIWGTWDRMPLINKNNEDQIYKAIIKKCKILGSTVIALGGMPDHVHLFVRFPSTVSIADFIKEIKGSTSHLINIQNGSDEFFKWQGSYAVFSVSDSQVSRIKSYIEHQKEHHNDHQTDPNAEL